MTEDELFDLLTAIEERVPLEEKPAQFEREANDLEPGEHGRASLLIAAGEHWQMRKEYDEARRCFRLAMRDGGESGSDPIANLLSLALDEGDAESVTEYDKTLRGVRARRRGQPDHLPPRRRGIRDPRPAAAGAALVQHPVHPRLSGW